MAQPELHSSHGVLMVVHRCLVGDASSYAMFDGQNGDPVGCCKLFKGDLGYQEVSTVPVMFLCFLQNRNVEYIYTYIWYKDNTKETIGRCMNLANG